MIKAAYGESIYHMLRAVVAISANAPEVMECNTILDETQIFEKVKHSPFIIPWCSMAYLSDPITNTFAIRGKDGQESTHAFDMQNTMPGNLRVKLSLYAATQEQIFTLENMVVSFFTEPKELTVVDFPGFNGSFTTALSINSEEETQRRVFNSAIEGNSNQAYRTQINLIANRCVAPYLPINQERIDSDFSMQYHLVDRLHALNAIYQCYCQYLDSTEDFTAGQVQYIRQIIKNIPTAREIIKTALHIPEAYNNTEYSKFLRAVMDNTHESAEVSLKKIRHTRNPGNSLHPAVRKQLIRDVKKALDIEQAIREHSDTLRKLQALQFEDAPPMPEQPKKEDFVNCGFDIEEFIAQSKEQQKTKATQSQSFMGMQIPSVTESEPVLNRQGKELYGNAWANYERQKQEYYKTALPEYEKRKAVWVTKRAECTEMVGLLLNEAIRQRLPHYAEIGFLPPAFQNLNAVSLVYQQLSSTNYPIQQILHDTDPLNARPGQIGALKTALELSNQIAEIKKQIDTVSAQSYAPRPAEPIKQEVPVPVYPAVKANVQFFTKENMAKSLLMGGPIGYYFTGHQDQIKAEEERIRNSPEYKQQCAAIDEEYRRKITAVEEQHRINLQQYHKTILPLYEKGLAEWTKQHNSDLASLKTELERLEKELAAHYDATRIVPTQYRNITALRHIHDSMQSANYSVIQAITNYELAVQRQIQLERLEEERRRADAAERAAEAAEYAAERAAYSNSGTSHNYSSSNSNNSPREEKRDYFMTRSCKRLKQGGFGRELCSGCSLAPVCRHAGS